MKYLVAGKHTHFKYDIKEQTVWCTHGSWGGEIKFNDDGSCETDGVKFKSYVLTDCDSFESAEKAGLIKF